MAGNAYNGIGVPDCVRTGTEAASSVLKSLGLLPPQ
jgi:protoporphyrinogen oxidase